MMRFNPGTVDITELCLKTHFTFDGTMYGQVKRIRMGFLVSRVIAEVDLLKQKKTARRTSTPTFRARYVDGTLTIVRRDHVGAL